MMMLPYILLMVRPIFGSWGDQSPVYKKCLQECQSGRCQGTSLEAWAVSQAFLEKAIGWTCGQDCSYSCMWRTVEVYGQHGRVPQFHGKWPFLRLGGMQEPASVIASLLNLVTNIYMVIWFTKRVSNQAAMYWVWVGYGLTAVNAWIMSSVFHTMDTPVTEMADYFSALTTVLASFLAFNLRITATSSSPVRLAIVTAFVAFFAHHVFHMATVHFDYGYNMKVNVASGGLNCISWLAWFFLHRRDGPHILYGVGAVLLVASSVALELLDFPPIYWIVDSHAIWHFATVPLPLLWFRFAAADALFHQKQNLKEEKLE